MCADRPANNPASNPASKFANGDDGSPGFGIYVHWPFCAAKCPYCDFNSHVSRQPIDQKRFAQAYEREMAKMAEFCRSRPTSLFFGGGTPSLMEPDIVSLILESVDRVWGLDRGIEISLEANPTGIEAKRFKAYRRAGINRVSIGVQSLEDEALRFLGRLHDSKQAIEAVELARTVFERVSFDLIYARPDQTPAQWCAELSRALALGADHLSLYQLTIEPNTPFYDLHKRGKLTPPCEDVCADLYELTHETTRSSGLFRYEISNHARPGYESRHNLTYWRSGFWAGLGPGAHGRLPKKDARLALVNHSDPKKWLEQVEREGHGIEEQTLLDERAIAQEYLLMGLRLSRGADLRRLEKSGGQSPCAEKIGRLAELGLLEQPEPNFLRVTAKGAPLLNSLLAELL